MSLPRLTVWAADDSPRLRYVLDWLLGERLGLAYELTADEALAAGSPHCLSYGYLEGAASIHATGLLWETGIRPHVVERQEWQGLHTLYFSADSPCDIQFDLLAGIFFLLTRYEEYFDFTADAHGRYPATSSILYEDGVLERPIVDEWVEALRLFLQEVWGITIPARPYVFQATYDIDIAWSYQHKGWKRSLGGGLRDLARGAWGPFCERVKVLTRGAPDPYNAFIWLAAQHMSYGIQPVWFFLAALQPSRYDKNIPPRHPRMAALIQAFSIGAQTGMHPSYYSDVYPERMSAEKAALETIIDQPVTQSRQHYIRLRFPQTYRALDAIGITDDWSMGYSTHLGFRAGTGVAFPWYDLPSERSTALTVHPFAFMDTTARFDMGLTAAQAFDRLIALAHQCAAVNGALVTVFHNFSLGTAPEWAGWRAGYEAFLKVEAARAEGAYAIGVARGAT